MGTSHRRDQSMINDWKTGIFSTSSLIPNPVGRVAPKVKLITNGNDLSSSTHTTKQPLTPEAWV